MSMVASQAEHPPLLIPESSHGHGHGHGGHGDGHGHAPHGAEYHGMPPLRRLLKVLRPERADIIAITVFSFGVALFNLVTPIAVEELVNTVARGTYLQPLVFISIIMFACLALAAVLKAMQHVIVEYMQQRLFVRVVADLSYRLPRVPQAEFDKQNAPDLVNRFFDVLMLQKGVASLLLDGLGIVLATAIGLLVLAFYHPWLMIFDIILIFFMTVVLYLMGSNAINTSIRESINKYRTAFWLQELVLHPRSFKMAGGPEIAVQRADELARDYVLSRRAHFRILFRQIVFMLSVQVVGSVALLGLGGWLVINRQLTLGQLVAAELIVTIVVTSFVKLIKSLETYYDLMAATDKLGQLIDLPIEHEGGESLPAVTELPNGRRGGGVVFRDVQFDYPDGRRVFENLSFEIKPGERIALIGGSATGKSTLLGLIDGMISPNNGLILIDNIDARGLSPYQLRKAAGLVQSVDIFDGTVLDNVLLGRKHLTPADARRALSEVGLLEHVLTWPEGINSFLVNGGRSLSFGQSILLMLARAIVDRPRLLLLDETLDNIDTEVRWQLLPFLMSPQAPWTLVVTTRRPDVVDLCDRSIVLQRENPGRPATIVDRPPADLLVPRTRLENPSP
jgi:ABC-type bacteriocin/lantibiotic exporter with double-glycine peptidase domain